MNGKRSHHHQIVNSKNFVFDDFSLKVDNENRRSITAESYNAVMKAYKAAKESADGGQAINAALQQATSVPLGVAKKPLKWRRLPPAATNQ